MRIVIVSGTMYPHISARSFRTTELAKGLARLGHNVTLYALLGDFDYTEFEESYNLKVKDLGPSRWGNINSDGIQNMTIMQRILRRLLYNVIDYPRSEYFRMTKKALSKEEPFDLLITIAHPFGVHWGAAKFKKKHPDLFKYWISDCGDPFMGDPDVKRWSLFQKPLEKFWCRQTDLITVPVENGKKGYYEEFRDKIIVIPQGIDFSSVEIDSYKKNLVPTFIYTGAVYPGMRDPSEFLDYICNKSIPFKFYVYAPSDSVFEKFFSRLGDRIEMHRYIDRRELIKVMSRMDFLININNTSQVQTPSKLIDYSLSKRPILNVSTNLSEEEKQTIDEFFKGDYSRRFIVSDLERYDAKNVCLSFIEAYERGC